MRLRNHILTTLLLISYALFYSDGVYAQTYANEEIQRIADSINTSKELTISHSELSETSVISEVEKPQYIVNMTCYQIQTIEVVNFGKDYTAEQIESFKLEAQSEILKNQFFIDLTKNEFVVVNRNDPTSFRIFNFKENEQLIQILCETCSIPEMKIFQMDNEQLILDIPNQDEGYDFDFRFIFKKL